MDRLILAHSRAVRLGGRLAVLEYSSMEKKNEVILQNTVVGNVVRYLLDRLGRFRGDVIERRGSNGTIYADCIQNTFPTIFDMSSGFNKIEVKYTTTITPQGNVEKAYGLWESLIGMTFEMQQLQTNTVQVTGQCDHAPVLSIFDDCWAAMLKAFGAIQAPQRPNSIADNQGGTVLYGRNEQGQAVILGGAVNPGYRFEIGPDSVTLKREGPAWLNHTAGNFQPGWHSPDDTDQILGIVGETLTGLAQGAVGQVDAENQQSGVKHGKSGRPHLPDDVWAWEQVNKLHRPTNEVKREWIAKLKEDPQRRNNIDLDRQFSKITKPDWGNKPD